MRILGVTWGIIGISALLLNAIYRLSRRTCEALEMDLGIIHWVVLVLFALFMMHSEGYKGFQKKFSPRTAERIAYLRDHPTWLRVLLAPVFCMGFFHANRKTRLTVTIITTLIILIVVIVSYCPQPWRGIIDLGVVLGLSWGLISFWIFTARKLAKKDPADEALAGISN